MIQQDEGSVAMMQRKIRAHAGSASLTINVDRMQTVRSRLYAHSTIHYGTYNDDYGATPVEIEKRRIKVKQIGFYQNDIN